MDDVLSQLEAKYCPPLDPALLSAILSDYDLTHSAALQDAHRILQELTDSALVEEAAGFDPSGTGAQGLTSSDAVRAESCPETSDFPTGDTDITSLSNGLSSVSLDEDEAETVHGAGSVDLEVVDEETKLALLHDLFGQKLSSYTIRHALKKANGKWQVALEDLLNQAYFDEAEDSETGQKLPAKGIDAFFEDDASKRKRKGRSKAKQRNRSKDRHATSLPSSPHPAPAVLPNRWKTASDDVEFIASRTRIAPSTVLSVYNDKGASVPQTIGALLKASMEESKHLITDDAVIHEDVRMLGQSFPTIAPEYLATIVRITHPSMPAAQELAQALTAKSPNAPGSIEIVPIYDKPDLVDEDHGWQVQVTSSRKSTGVSRSDAGDTDPATLAKAYAIAKATAFSQASAAHRKAKSDRLMGGAAAYYSQVGRDYAAMSSQASAAAADELAAAQSTASGVDLHGVDVANAMRIALSKTEDWWARLGESRVNGRLGADERSSGYSIVVGLGRHSEGGKSKLGPAVSKALREAGWRIENAGAVIVVKGKAKR